MAEKVRITSDFLVFSGSTTNNPNDLNKLKNSFDKEIKDSSRQKVIMAANETDKTVSLPQSSCDFLAIFGDQSIKVYVNGSLTGDTLESLKAGQKGPMLMRAGELTELKIDNLSAKEANLDIFILKI